MSNKTTNNSHSRELAVPSLKASSKKVTLDNPEGYRVVLTCGHEKIKTGTKAQSPTRL